MHAERPTIGRSGPQRGSGTDDTRRRLLTETVATAFDVSADRIMASGRGPARIATARQFAIYLARMRLGLSFTDAGRLFRRDRTTAAYACRRIEDMRDDERIDALLDRLEQRLVRLLEAEGALS